MRNIFNCFRPYTCKVSGACNECVSSDLQSNLIDLSDFHLTDWVHISNRLFTTKFTKIINNLGPTQILKYKNVELLPFLVVLRMKYALLYYI